MLAATLGEAAERRRAERAAEEEKKYYKAIWRDLQIRLEETFCFTRQQKVRILWSWQLRSQSTPQANVGGIVQDAIYNGNRTNFLAIHVDVIVRFFFGYGLKPAYTAQAILDKRQALLSLDNIFGVPGRERNLAQLTKCQCSSVRNAWRADVSLSSLSYTLCVLIKSEQAHKRRGPQEFCGIDRLCLCLSPEI